jgi:cell division septum initiation protein DivIVA
LATNKTAKRVDMKVRTRAFGFDKTAVRSLVSGLVDELEEARTQVEALKQQLNRGRGESTGATTPEQHEAAQLVERVLASTHRVADEIRTEAERDAARLVSEAREKAAKVLDEAATAAQETNDAAADRLRAIERDIERMQASHGEVRFALEAAARAVGAVLADVSALDTRDAGRQTDEKDADSLKLFAPEEKLRAQA